MRPKHSILRPLALQKQTKNGKTVHELLTWRTCMRSSQTNALCSGQTPSRAPAPRFADHRELYSSMPPSGIGARQRQCRHKARTKPYEAPGWSIATYIRVVVKVSPLPKVPLGTAAVLHCWPSRLYQTLSMRCNGRRGHYLLELGYAEGPTGSITLHEGGVIVVLLCPALVVLT